MAGAWLPSPHWAPSKIRTLRLTATVLSADGKQRLDRESTIPLGESPIESAQKLAKEVADGLRADGAVELIEASR